MADHSPPDWDEDLALAQMLDIGARGLRSDGYYGDFFLGLMFSQKIRDAVAVHKLLGDADFVHLEQLVLHMIRNHVDTGSMVTRRRVADGYYDAWVYKGVVVGIQAAWLPIGVEHKDNYRRIPDPLALAIDALDNLTGNRVDPNYLKRPLIFYSTEEKQKYFFERAARQVQNDLINTQIDSETKYRAERLLRTVLDPVGLGDAVLHISIKEDEGTISFDYERDDHGRAVLCDPQGSERSLYGA